MRVLHFYRTFFPETQGGLEEAIRQIVINSARFGVESAVLVPSDSGPSSFEIDGIEVHTFKRHGEIASCDWSLSALPVFKRLCEWCDVLNFHFPWPFADLMSLLGGSKVPYIVTYHSDIVRQRGLGVLYQPLMDLTLKRAARIVATSNSYVQSSPVLRSHKSKTEVIPLGLCEPESLLKNSSSVDDRLPGEYLLFVGVLRYYKGLQFLVSAMKGLDITLLIAGDGPERQGLEQQARDLGLTNVKFVGRISDEKKYELLEGCSLFVLPSSERSEAFGVSLIEAAMFGKPMISCELGTGTSFVNSHKETGLVVQPKDPDALRAAINRLMAESKLRVQYGKRARERFEELFSGEALGKAYAELYHSVLAEASNPAR